MKTEVSEHEKEEILRVWLAFARTKIFANRGMEEAAFALFAPECFRYVLEHSNIAVDCDKDGELQAVLVYESTESAFIVHWCWTRREERNLGLQKRLWESVGIDPVNSNIFISSLTVVVEKLIKDKGYNFLFNPYVNHKGSTFNG